MIPREPQLAKITGETRRGSLAVEAPGWAKAYPFQREAAYELATGKYKGIWGAPGIGKTLILLLAWDLLGLDFPALVITKALGRFSWVRDAAWVLGPDYVPGVLTEGMAYPPGRHDFYGRRTYTSLPMALSERLMVVVNYEILAQRIDELFEIPWRFVVLDEVHEIKGGHKPARKRDGSLHLLRYHRVKLLTIATRARGGHVFTATATPIINRRRDLYAQVDVAQPDSVGSSFRFLQHFCGGYLNEWNGLVADGETNTEELNEKLSKIFKVITKAQVADQLPKLTWDVSLVPHDGKLMAHAGGSIETALDRAAAMKKDAVEDKVIEYLSAGLKIVVLYGRRRLATQCSVNLTSPSFAKKLPRRSREKYTVRCATGDTELSKRLVTVEEFNRLQTGPAALVCTYDAIRDSIDIHQADGVILAQLPDRPGALEQLIGRFQRIGGRPSVLHVMIAERTIDEAYRERVINKLKDAMALGATTEGTALNGLQGGAFDEEELLRKLVEDLAGLE